MNNLVSIKNLTIKFKEDQNVVDNVNIDIPKGKTVAIVGERGSGKSTTARVVTGLLPQLEGDIIFDREKLSKSIYIALKKRPIDTETVEKFISKISRSLEELGQNEVSSNSIGTMVMDGLKEMDPVAYIRFASVYRNFREEKDFVQFVDKIDVFKKR